MSLTPVKLSETVKGAFTGVIDTSEEFNETREANFTGVVDTGEALNLFNISANNRNCF